MAISAMLLTLGMTACRSTENPSATIPDMTLVRPERPYLDGTSEDMVLTLMEYAMRLEIYADGMEDYIQRVGEILG